VDKEIWGHCEDCNKEIVKDEGHYNFGGEKMWCDACGEKKVSPGLVI